MVEIKEMQLASAYKISVLGEVDASSSIHLDNALSTAIAEHPNILIDLTELEYISSAGLGVFISYLEDIRSKEVKLVLFGMTEKVKQVFQILGIHDLMTITADEETALKALE